MTVRILVADDSITIQKIVAMAFENEDAEVEGIGDGQEAFDKIPDFKPDIVLADVDMPGLDGFELCQEIKENPELAKIKVLLLASDFEDFDEERFKKCQAENHISKPFKSDDIVQMVTRVLEGATATESEDEPSLSESFTADEPNTDDEPSLEELLASVEKLSTDSMETTDDPIEGIDDVPLPVEAEINEEPSAASDDDVLGQLIQEVENEISHDPAPVISSDDDVLGQLIQEVENEISHDPAPVISSDDDILGEMIQEVQTELEESATEPELVSPERVAPELEEPALEEQSFSEDFEVYAEVQTGKMENLDDLDSAFKEIVAGDPKQPSIVSSEVKESGISALGGIVPEPEDLLERMAPGAFSESERRPHTADEINENLNAITGPSSFGSTHYQDSRLQEKDFENNDDRFIQVTGEQVRHVLEKSLGSSLQKEMSGLSDIIVKTIREVVREITPEIARSVIREEIEKIKRI
ncbi:MAG: response regulator [Nitrospina sp.]|jgi:CheY-like chemotaxis protein|nr:response regulator [Nitrospina sp.]MBT6717046.1 response regulator [Nitrospina sp.]